jgi:hypothetical protein
VRISFRKRIRASAFGDEAAGSRPVVANQTVCGAFLIAGFITIGGVRVGLMVGLSCRSGSIEVIRLQAPHLYT